MPKMLALIAVQRQAAASRSTRPLRREQHGITGGEPTVTLTKLSTLAHTPNLRASLGHLPRADGKWRIVGAKCWRYWHVVNGCFVAGFDWECHGRA
ncbi:hypothetical protein GOBAR_DD19532 [Gossypium barbadense]|nr:hypothetical protein GOBAR_DD19532 [Gossypium barbadense]